MTTFANRLTAALARVPQDMHGRVRARVQARPHELADLERVVERRYGGVTAAAARPAKRRAKPRSLSAELDAAIRDGRIVASRRAHYERLAAKDGEAKVVKLLASLAPGLDPATRAALATPADAPSSDEPWMPPRRSRAPGWIGAGRRPSRRIDWSLDGADVQASSGPDLTQPPFTAPPQPNLAPLGTPRANGHGVLPPGRSVPGTIIDGNGPGQGQLRW